MDAIAGRAFNIGGGPGNSLSLLELIDLIGELDDRKPQILFQPARIADQRYYVTDSSRFQSETGWFPAVAAQRGVELLYHWLLDRKAAVFRRRRLARSDDEVCAYQSPVVVSG